ncbi:MAG TPA: hypothetical protein VFO73_14950 [Candidatus Limnocylindrales bacterium]|nr:hypothetical protein [Candidatus Limnocylindrales bacterium]
MRIRSVFNHSFQAVLEGALIAMIVVGLIAGTAFAAKGGGKVGAGGTLALVMVTDANGNGLPNWGDQVTFNVSTTATDRPTVRLHCYQNDNLVYTFSAGFFAGYPWTTVYGLSSQSWTGGAADCTASLIYSRSGGRIVTLATLNFAAGG